MLGVYNYTVILTYLGMLAGFTGILFAMGGDVHMALLFLMIAGLCDMFDGAVASTRKRTDSEKRFGVQIDSLSDLICFGALPAVTVYAASGRSVLSACCAGAYLLCALIRLAWFNVDEEERQGRETGSRVLYSGLPVTTAALILPALMELCGGAKLPAGNVAPFVLLAMAAAFLTPFHLRKPQLAGKIALLVCGIAILVLLLMGVDL